MQKISFILLTVMFISNALYADSRSLPTQSSVMGLAGSGNALGAHTTSEPISLPPGRNGLQPKLDLNYSTLAGNSEVGYGWSLSLPHIRKSRVMIREFTSSVDGFLSPHQGAAAGKGLYTPMIKKGFSRYRKINEHTWVRWSEDGTRHVFHSLLDEGVNPVHWYLVATLSAECVNENSFCNKIIYTYESDPGSLFGTNTKKLLSKVSYNFVNSSVALTVIRLEYKNNREDLITLFNHGLYSETSVLLSDISVEHQRRRIERYHLIHKDPVGVIGFSTLKKVQRIRPSGKMYPSTVYSYAGENGSFDKILRVKPIEGLQSKVLRGSATFIDMSGDGRVDQHWQGQDNQVALFKNISSPYEDVIEFELKPKRLRQPFTGHDISQVQFVDLDGDGKWDMVDNQNRREVSLHDSTKGWGRAQKINQSQKEKPALKKNNFNFIDANGDGLADILDWTVDGSGSKLVCWINKGKSQFEIASTFKSSHFVTKIKTDSDAKFTHRFVDINGDHLLDILYFKQGKLKAFVSKGNCDFTKSIDLSIRFNLSTDLRKIFAKLNFSDVNFDGMTDVFYSGLNGLFVWVNTGDLGFNKAYEFKQGARFGKRSFVQDFDGDGIKEIMICRSNRCEVAEIYEGSKPGLMIEKKDAYGGYVKISYKPSTQKNLTEKTNTPMVVSLVDQVVTSDGLNPEKTETHKYKNGFFNNFNRSFFGYQYINSEISAASWSLAGKNLISAPKSKSHKEYFYALNTNDPMQRMAKSGQLIRSVDGLEKIQINELEFRQQQNVLGLVKSVNYQGIADDKQISYKKEEKFYNHLGLQEKDIVSEGWSTNNLLSENNRVLTMSNTAYSQTEVDPSPVYIKDIVTIKPTLLETFDRNGQLVAKKLYDYDSHPLMRVVREINFSQKNKSVVKKISYSDEYPYLVRSIFDDRDQLKAAYNYDDHGLSIASQANGENEITQFIYDSATGLVLNETTPNGVVTSFRYDHRNRVVTVESKKNDILIKKAEIEHYDQLDGHPAVMVKSDWKDSSGKNKALSVTHIDPRGEVLAEFRQGPDSKTILSRAVVFDNYGRETLSLNENVFVNCAPLDCDYRQVVKRHPHKIKIYGENLKVKKVDWPLEKVSESFSYGLISNSSYHFVTFTNKMKHSLATVFDVNEKRVEKSYDSDEGRQSFYFQRDALGYIQSVILPSGRTREYQRNFLGQVLSVYEDGRHLFTNAYDSRGLLAEKNWSEGQSEKMSYDLADRLIFKSYFNSKSKQQLNTKISYGQSSAANNIGKIESVEQPSGTVKNFYNSQGLITASSKHFNDNGKTYDITNSFDFAGNLIEKNINDELPIKFRYDNRGWLTSIDNYVSDLTRKTPTKLESHRMANGIVVERGYLAKNLLLSDINIVAGNSKLQNYHYKYDNNGHVISRDQDSGASVSYTYNQDITAKLKNYKFGSHRIDYSYDIDNGLIQKNKLSRSQTGQISSFEGADYSFGVNRRIKTKTKNGNSHHINYDGENMPAVESSNGLKVYHIDDFYKVVNGKPFARIELLGQVIAETSEKSTRFIVSDYINSPLAHYDSFGKITHKITSDPFGNEIEITNRENFPAYSTGMAGLYYNRVSDMYLMQTRFYDPKAKEFVRMDPLALQEPSEFLDSQVELNLFQYAKNNPANYTDPSGKKATAYARPLDIEFDILGETYVPKIQHLFLTITDRPIPYRDLVISLEGTANGGRPKIHVFNEFQTDLQALTNKSYTDSQIIKPPQGVSEFDFDEKLIDVALEQKENARNSRYPLAGFFGFKKVDISTGLGNMQFEVLVPFGKNSNSFVNDTVEGAGGNIKKFDWAPNQKLSW